MLILTNLLILWALVSFCLTIQTCHNQKYSPSPKYISKQLPDSAWKITVHVNCMKRGFLQAAIVLLGHSYVLLYGDRKTLHMYNREILLVLSAFLVTEQQVPPAIHRVFYYIFNEQWHNLQLSWTDLGWHLYWNGKDKKKKGGGLKRAGENALR